MGAEHLEISVAMNQPSQSRYISIWLWLRLCCRCPPEGGLRSQAKSMLHHIDLAASVAQGQAGDRAERNEKWEKNVLVSLCYEMTM